MLAKKGYFFFFVSMHDRGLSLERVILIALQNKKNKEIKNL